MDEDMTLEGGAPLDETLKNCDCEDCDTLEERILECMSESSNNECCGYVTIMDYLAGSVDVAVPKESLITILIDRDVDVCAPVSDVEPSIRKLCKADVMVLMAMGITRRGAVTDSDNGWSHSDGGWTLSDDARKMLLDAANKIYEEAGEPTVGKTKMRIRSTGIRKADTTIYGCHKIRFNR